MNFFRSSTPKPKNLADRLKNASHTMVGRNRDILEAFIQIVELSHTESDADAMSKLCNTLWTEQCSSMQEIFAGEESQVLAALFGDAFAGRVKAIWDRSPSFIYDTGYARRSWRSKSEHLYVRPMVTKLISLLYLAEEGLTPESYLDFAIPDDNYFLQREYFCVVPELLALEVDEGNQAVKDRLKDIIFAETTHRDDIRTVIKALLMSRDREAHEWIGQLLLAAKLQEGLRQAIAELMDQGSRESFVYLLELVLDHDLQRFSSIVRALDVWTGLGIEAQQPSVVKKCLTAAHRCLTDQTYLAECLASSDAILIYIGLWAIAVDDVNATAQPVEQLLASPETYKRTTALYFVVQTRFPQFQHRVSEPLVEDPELEVRGWALRNLFGGATYASEKYVNQFKAKSDLNGLFDRLLSLLHSLPKKEVRFEGTVFPWSYLFLSRNLIIEKMIICALALPPDEKVDVLMSLRDKMEVDTRSRFITDLLKKASPDIQRPAILEFLGDKSSQVRSDAMKLAADISFRPEEYLTMEDLMRLKSGDLRKNIMSLLLRQSPNEVLQSIERLAEAKNENKQLAALDLLVSVEKDDRFQEILDKGREIAKQIAGTTQKANALAQQLIGQERPQYTRENGFGLYDPHKQVALNLPRFSENETTGFPFPSLEQVSRLLEGFDRAVEANKEYEYEVESWGGSREKVILGATRYFMPFERTHSAKETLDKYPLPDVWRQTAADLGLTPATLVAALFFYEYQPLPDIVHDWFGELTAKLFPYAREACRETLTNLQYPSHVSTILSGLLLELPPSDIFRLLCEAATHLIRSIPADRFAEEYRTADRYTSYTRSHLFTAGELAFWLFHMKRFVYDDASFEAFFAVAYNVYQLSKYQTRNALDLNDFERAFHAGLLDENELFAEVTGRVSSPDNLRVLSSPDTSYSKKRVVSCHTLLACYEIVIDRVLSIELNRGDMPTEVSHLAAKIERCQGMKYFTEILITGEKETYIRGYNYATANGTKKEMFSQILSNCYPVAGEDAETLRRLLNGRKVTDKQLIDAAMYAPQWLEIVEAYLGWPGLAMAGWYFHAHVGESFSNEKKTIVARYSPIEPEDFQFGAFDIQWFREAYDTIGEERFQTVYGSAKYIGGGAVHRRSQLFADAVLGHLSVADAEKEIREKRNKDYVLVLGLIP
ncbi:MAG TPA: DUF5724 domain-containing protein, partial [Bacilli bacterium]|nr:DUF5724 domain-containing protein [Bacilli bacterium]